MTNAIKTFFLSLTSDYTIIWLSPYMHIANSESTLLWQQYVGVQQTDRFHAKTENIKQTQNFWDIQIEPKFHKIPEIDARKNCFKFGRAAWYHFLSTCENCGKNSRLPPEKGQWNNIKICAFWYKAHFLWLKKNKYYRMHLINGE